MRRNGEAFERFANSLEKKPEECSLCDVCRTTVVSSVFVIDLECGNTKRQLLHHLKEPDINKALTIARNFQRATQIEATQLSKPSRYSGRGHSNARQDVVHTRGEDVAPWKSNASTARGQDPTAKRAALSTHSTTHRKQTIISPSLLRTSRFSASISTR